LARDRRGHTFAHVQLRHPLPKSALKNKATRKAAGAVTWREEAEKNRKAREQENRKSGKQEGRGEALEVADLAAWIRMEVQRLRDAGELDGPPAELATGMGESRRSGKQENRKERLDAANPGTEAGPGTPSPVGVDADILSRRERGLERQPQRSAEFRRLEAMLRAGRPIKTPKAMALAELRALAKITGDRVKELLARKTRKYAEWEKTLLKLGLDQKLLRPLRPGPIQRVVGKALATRKGKSTAGKRKAAR
jgi:hypothetical protein